MVTGYCGNLAFKIIDVFNSFMVGPVVIIMKMKRLIAFCFKTLHVKIIYHKYSRYSTTI